MGNRRDSGREGNPVKQYTERRARRNYGQWHSILFLYQNQDFWTLQSEIDLLKNLNVSYTLLCHNTSQPTRFPSTQILSSTKGLLKREIFCTSSSSKRPVTHPEYKALSHFDRFCENGSLHNISKRFGKFPENLVAVYISQVLEGLVYLHDQGVIHRDIKGANILTNKDGTVKLADFGVAARTGGVTDSAVVGSPYWSMYRLLVSMIDA